MWRMISRRRTGGANRRRRRVIPGQSHGSNNNQPWLDYVLDVCLLPRIDDKGVMVMFSAHRMFDRHLRDVSMVSSMLGSDSFDHTDRSRVAHSAE